MRSQAYLKSAAVTSRPLWNLLSPSLKVQTVASSLASQLSATAGRGRRGERVEGHQAVEDTLDDLYAFGFLAVPRIDEASVQ